MKKLLLTLGAVAAVAAPVAAVVACGGTKTDLSAAKATAFKSLETLDGLGHLSPTDKAAATKAINAAKTMEEVNAALLAATTAATPTGTGTTTPTGTTAPTIAAPAGLPISKGATRTNGETGEATAIVEEKTQTITDADVLSKLSTKYFKTITEVKITTNVTSSILTITGTRVSDDKEFVLTRNIDMTSNAPVETVSAVAKVGGAKDATIKVFADAVETDKAIEIYSDLVKSVTVPTGLVGTSIEAAQFYSDLLRAAGITEKVLMESDGIGLLTAKDITEDDGTILQAATDLNSEEHKNAVTQVIFDQVTKALA